MEIIYPAANIKCTTNKFTLTINSNRKESIALENNDNAEYNLFSDESGQENRIGSAAILYKKGRSSQVKSLKAYLGTSDEQNTYKAKIIGAITALWLLQTTLDTISKKVSLYTDNQSIIDALSTPKLTSGQYLINTLIIAANTAKCKLGIRWILGHSKAKGNEAADKLTKEAATGHSSSRVNLPHILQMTLPSSASASKQKYISLLKTKWEQIWDASPQRHRIALFGGEFPFSSFCKQLNELSKKTSQPNIANKMHTFSTKHSNKQDQQI